MKKIRLSPFVAKTKGKKNWLLHDFLNSKIYNITTDGCLDEFKKQLLESKLAIETKNVIPFKYHINVENSRHIFALKRLTIRITSRCDQNCSFCGEACKCFKNNNDSDIDKITMKEIINQFKNLRIDEIELTGGNPTLRMDLVERVQQEFKKSKITLKFFGKLNPDIIEKLNNLGIKTCNNELYKSINNEEHFMASPETYFYFKLFNPCWGQTLSVDVDGDIRPCLWWDESICNIKTSNIKDIFEKEGLKKYWELTKDNIDECNGCEYRYACGSDCRVLAKKMTGSLVSKTLNCSYSPKIGKWED